MLSRVFCPHHHPSSSLSNNVLSQPCIKLTTTSTFIALEDQKLLDLEASTSLGTYGMDHYMCHITATISATQLSSLSGDRDFFRVCVEGKKKR